MKIFKESNMKQIIMLLPIIISIINIIFFVSYIELLKTQENLSDNISNIIIFASILFILTTYFSWIVSKKVSRILKRYKKSITVKQNALENINVVLEKKVEKKTLQLAKLNEELYDIVEQEVEKNRQKDEVLFQQSKMAAMGEMINNIAHQWRQPLSTISTASSGLSIKVEMDMIEKDELKSGLEQIVETTQHLSQTIEDFRNFFIENKKVEKFILNELLKKDLSLSASSLKTHHIEVFEKYANIEYVGIKNELIQAVLNIINNAKDALVDNTNEDFRRMIFLETYKDEDNVYISIYDNAGGIKKEILSKVFEPYFTTKHQSHGTGIGLYMTREIIVNHMNGTLDVSNKKFSFDDIDYMGANFVIKLPLENSYQEL